MLVRALLSNFKSSSSRAGLAAVCTSQAHSNSSFASFSSLLSNHSFIAAPSFASISTNSSNRKDQNVKFPNFARKTNTLDLDQFEQTYDLVLNDVTRLASELDDVSLWAREMLNYNVRDGKKIRPLAFLHTYYSVTDGQASAADLQLAYILAWCLEFYQVFFIVADDIMDESITRRGKLCWHRKEEVGMIAINDCIFIEASIYQLLKKYFSHHQCYSDILHLFLEIKQKTVYGQSLDLLSSPTTRRVPIDQFSIERYFTIATYKTAFYSTVLPVRLALYLARVSDPAVHEQLEKLMIKMGIFWQIQDDYLDAFADPAITGKIGTDIQDGKCCWPVVTALKLATNQQREVLTQNFGVKNEESVQKVRQVYEQLNIESIYREHEQRLFEELQRLSDKLCEDYKLPIDMFQFLLTKLHRRNK